MCTPAHKGVASLKERAVTVYIPIRVPRPDLTVAQLNVSCVLTSGVPSYGLLFTLVLSAVI